MWSCLAMGAKRSHSRIDQGGLSLLDRLYYLSVVNALPAGLRRGGVPNQKGYKQFILLLVATCFFVCPTA